MKKLIFLLFALMTFCCQARVTDMVELRVAPADGHWTAEVGQPVSFTFMLTESNVGLSGVFVEYEIGEDLMEYTIKGKVKVKDGIATVKGGTMKKPGFLRCKASCKVGGHSYSASGTIGFSPEKITPTTQYPEDFMSYWETRLAIARSTPLNPEMVLLPEKCTKKVNVYQVSYCVGSPRTRFYAMLAIPKAEGKYPAIVQYPGAGTYPIDAPVKLAEKGAIAMAVGIHSIPNNLDADIYRGLDGGVLSSYPTMNMERRDNYYYNRVIQGAVLAVDFIATLPEFNGCVATYGGSQGGYLSIAVGALHNSVKFVVANFPAMSDLAGYAHGRAGGWPHIFKDEKNRTPQLFENLSYYDTVNFARNISAPGFYAFGFNDITCAPTTTYSVYNQITAPKTLYTAPLAGHFLLAEQSEAELDAMFKFLRECGE
ncbi:MAG: acetylxylan esterase [Muribaculaceae bacterium]|nr:acetylxylan esterase [Muribaculaceae bacterium]